MIVDSLVALSPNFFQDLNEYPVFHSLRYICTTKRKRRDEPFRAFLQKRYEFAQLKLKTNNLILNFIPQFEFSTKKRKNGLIIVLNFRESVAYVNDKQ